MCCRPSAVTRDCDDGKHVCCPTCGMPGDIDMRNCPYCGDPVPQDSPDEFKKVDPAHSTRIL